MSETLPERLAGTMGFFPIEATGHRLGVLSSRTCEYNKFFPGFAKHPLPADTVRIKLKELIGPRCLALDEGYRVYDLIFPELKNQRTVELDFEGVEQVFSPFLMGAVGRLLAHFEKTTLLQRLTPCRISEDHLRTFNDFLDRADRRDSEQSDQDTLRDLFEEDELGAF